VPFVLFNTRWRGRQDAIADLLNRAGYAVLTTCSPRNFSLCKSRGAEAVFDYTDAECGEKIHQYTKGQLQLVFDTIGSDDGVKICMDALSKDTSLDKRYGTLLFNDIPRKDVKKSFTVLVTFAGEAFSKFGKHFPASTDGFEFAKKFTALTERLVAEGKLLATPVRMVDRGLLGMVEEGIPLGESGKVSGEKVVARVGDTPLD
jgi:NADPH:quinone reductase-like Zn-dependent oxidoreductase